VSGISLFYAVLLVFYSNVLMASDPYAGHRLFHTAEERSMPANADSADEIKTDPRADEERPVVKVTPRMKQRKVYLVKRLISFDGIVIRHDDGGDGTVVSWINGAALEPKRWSGGSVNDHQLSVNRYGQHLTLRVGQQGTVTVERNR